MNWKSREILPEKTNGHGVETERLRYHSARSRRLGHRSDVVVATGIRAAFGTPRRLHDSFPSPRLPRWNGGPAPSARGGSCLKTPSRSAASDGRHSARPGY